nr:MAG TPA: hypothetical protein [Caudoviricetes sp.]
MLLLVFILDVCLHCYKHDYMPLGVLSPRGVYACKLNIVVIF